MDFNLIGSSVAIVIYLIFGGIFTGVSLFGIIRGIRSRDWTLVEGKVLGTEIKRDSDGDYSTELICCYDVDGQVHQVTETFTFTFPTKENAIRVQEKYPNGMPVPVWHDPTHPATAVLKQGSRWGQWFWLVIGLGLLALALAIGMKWVMVQ